MSRTTHMRLGPIVGLLVATAGLWVTHAASFSVSAAAPTLSGPSRNADFNGDGITDWAVVRGVGGTLVWYIENTGGFSAVAWGAAATDFLVPADYDGDGKSDVAIWRPGAPGTFWVRNSGTGTVSVIPWGTTGDNPTATADFDGDGKADPAVYRCPSGGSPGQCFFWVMKSTGGIIAQPWGYGSPATLFNAKGDYDGDGKADFAIQGTNPTNAGAGLFHLLRSADLGYEPVLWGYDTDLIVPGDYDGDGKSDISVMRNVSGARTAYIRHRTGAVTFAVWGFATDSLVPGDYDGDGKTDLAVWRPSGTPGQSAFWVKRSSDGGTIYKPFGASGDVTVAGWIVQ